MNSETEQTKEKPGRRTAGSSQIKDMEHRIETLERCLAKIAHYSGSQRILDEFKIPRWEPSKRDFGKFKD